MKRLSSAATTACTMNGEMLLMLTQLFLDGIYWVLGWMKYRCTMSHVGLGLTHLYAMVIIRMAIAAEMAA